MRFSLFAACLATAVAQSISPPPAYSAPPTTIATSATSAPPSTIIYGTGSPASSDPAAISILPIYPITTAISNSTTPAATSAAYCTPKKNGTSVGAPDTSAAPTRYVDPETPMDPAEYGGGAMGNSVGVSMLAIVAAGAYALL
ncbi:uncharacterized protein RCC_02585 [Ramularia collo-cygni]|uniref:Uncharacterized protein n=1 Tax=Ramularia collo-cygni TaxID=112498 RepID=A0A2D3UUU3_9PEZI|nr:uncharacterized protein RCC_02585 [Ramularia collo-cygni]CZT16750.1 uncharacterized protein RCC_02585 [Ramularia collo-cygni]